MSADTTVRGLNPELAWSSFFSDPSWLQKTAVGATFNALMMLMTFLNLICLPIVCILWALVIGYQLRVIRTKIAEPDAKLPPWREWVDLMISGLTWIAFSTGFFVFIISIPTIGLIVGSITHSMYAPDPRFIVWATTTFTLTFTLSLFVGLIVTYLQANFAEEENTMAALKLFKVLKRIREHGRDLLLAWLLSCGLMCAAVIVPACTIIGVFLIPCAVFIAGTISATMIAQAWSASSNVAPA